MPTVADTNELDSTKYKIVEKDVTRTFLLLVHLKNTSVDYYAHSLKAMCIIIL